MKNTRQNKKILATFIGLFGFFCVVTITYSIMNNAENNPDRIMQSKKDKNKKTDARQLELNEAKDTSSEIRNEPSALFNDPAIKQAWGLKKSDAGRAWSVTKGNKKVIVAIIDTGIDEKHEDLKGNLWTNPGETGLDAKGRNKATNGIDDDGNGFIDDVHGWNFVSSNNKLDDNHGHGTHIAGIIGAEAGNNKGISGISPEVSLMVLKYFDPKVPNNDNLKNTVSSIEYAVKMGAHIINYSGGGTDFSQEEHDAIEKAEAQGILFVAAAGNERSNSDKFHYYPADYKLKNIISVTAIDPTTEVLSSSNYGTETVDIAAPGQNILSCLPQNTYGLMTGTSQATAFVTGAAVLVMAHKNLYNNAEEIKKYILATGDSTSSLVGKTRTSRQLNLFKALTILEGTKTAFSGVDTGSIQDRRVFSNRDKGNDPNMKQDEGTKSLNDVASFGQEFLKSVKGAQNKKKKAEKVGTEIQPDSGQN
jgi:subtilisin family serine protease